MTYRFTEIRRTVFSLLEKEELNSVIYFAGGIVPWILADRESNREHGDIDIVVEENNMPIIRKYLEENVEYSQRKDSKCLTFNSKKFDFGLEVQINNITVNISPFTINDDCLIQRNFSMNQGGDGVLLQATLKGISYKDFFTRTKIGNGLTFNSYSLEAVKAAKIKSSREKDKIDALQIDKMGINQKVFLQLSEAFNNMKIKLIAQNNYEDYL